jgi:spermidine synthase
LDTRYSDVERGITPARGLVPILLTLFFLSGACALIYQILWLRLLGLVFGVTVYAASTVWASFMAGLAIGSVIGGRIGDRTARPLVWFGVAEMLIAATAASSPMLLRSLQEVYVEVHGSLPHGMPALTAIRAAMAFAVLAAPTTLMGATLPLVVRSALFRADQLGSRVSLLYGTNTAGAIAGTLLAGLYLVPTAGIQRTFWIAAATNVLVGIAAVTAGWSMAPRRVTPAATAEAEARTLARGSPAAPSADRVVRNLVLAVFFVSGFASLALEVVWFRVITLIVRPTVYAFAAILATVLLGIAVGSYAVTPWTRRKTGWLTALVVVEALVAFTTLFSLSTLNESAAVQAVIEPYVARILPAYLAFPLGASLPALLPTTLLWGIAFPIGLRVWAGDGSGSSSRAASRIGVFYAFNVVGAILGSLAAGFVLVPRLGTRTTLIMVAALPLAAAVALMWAGGGRRRLRAALSAPAILAFVAASASVQDPFQTFLSIRYPDQELVWFEEAPQSTVSVHRGEVLTLAVEGNHQASDGGGMVSAHRSIGHLPLVVHPHPLRALVVGLGGGATAGAASLHDGVELTVVELNAAVVRAARHFEHVNHGILDRPHVRVLVDDGRNHLMLSKAQYDVVTADIILPLYAGSANLYSADYFRLVERALRPGGLALQWVAGTEAEYKTIMRTFLSVFPETTLWARGSLMIGSRRPLRLHRGDFQLKQLSPGTRQAMAELGTNTFEDLLALYVAGPDALRTFVGPGPILTDDRPLVEYFLSLPRDRDVDLSGLRGDPREILAHAP